MSRYGTAYCKEKQRYGICENLKKVSLTFFHVAILNGPVHPWLETLINSFGTLGGNSKHSRLSSVENNRKSFKKGILQFEMACYYR